MKALKKLLVVVMVMSLVVHPALIDVLLAADPVGNDPKVLSYYPETWNPPTPPPPPPEPDPAIEEAEEEEQPALAISADLDEAPESVGMPNPLAVWVQEQGWKYELTTNPDGSQTGTIVKPNGETFSDEVGWKLFADATKASQALTPEDQADAEEWLKVKPVSVKVEAGPATDHSYSTTYNYYDENGVLVGSKSVLRTDNVGESKTVWKDKNGLELGRIEILPTRFEVAPEQQAGIKTIFGADPANYTIRRDGVTGDTTYTYYDAQGIKIGQMTETYGATEYPDPIKVTGQTFYDKDGKEIDLAAKIGSVDIDTAANVIKALDPSTADATLAKLDKTDPAKANDIRIKCGMDPDLGTMTPDAAADYLAKLNDPVKAGAMLAKLDPIKAADIIASSKMSEGDAARILRKMDADKAAAILSARHPSEIDMGNGLIMTIAGEYGPVINAQKAAGILNNMSKTKAAAILGSDKMDKGVAGSILNNVATEDAVKILTKMDAGKAAEILSKIDLYGGLKGLWLGGGISKEKATEILSAMSSKKAAAIIGSDKMDDRAAATLMGALDVQTAVKILGKVSDDKAAAILSNLTNQFGPIRYLEESPVSAESGLWPRPSSGGITAEQAGNILAGLKAEKAAGILASDKMSVENAGKILTEAKKTNEQAVTDMLTKLDGTNKVKADQIREKIGATAGTTLTAQEQANYGTIFGTTPVTKKVTNPPEGWTGGSTRTDFYDKDGNLVGSMTEGIATNHTIKNFLDKDGKQIDVGERLNQATVTADQAADVVNSLDKETQAAIFASDKLSKEKGAAILNSAKITVDTAANVLGNTDETKANLYLTELDKTNKVKADQIREKMGSATDITKMTADQAAEYLSKITDPIQAAAELEKLDIYKAAEALNSAKMTADVAAKILGAMDEGKVAEILSASETCWIAWNTAGVSAKDSSSFTPFQNDPVLDPAKAAQILGKLTPAKEASILSNDKMDASIAGQILANTTDVAAACILNSMDVAAAANILSNTSADAAAKIVAKLGDDKAAQILGNAKPISAANIFNVIAPETAAKILAKMDTGAAAKIFSFMDTAAAATVAGAMDPAKAASIFASDNISVDAASKILYGMDDQKATKILQQLDTINSAKSGELRAKLGIGSNDISKMIPEVAAEYLSKLDPAQAATELAKLDAVSAANIIASSKMTTDTAAKILGKMDAAKAAEILSANSGLVWSKLAAENNQVTAGIPFFMGTNVIDAAKAAEILSKMTADQAAAIIGNDKMDNVTAAELMGTVDLQKAISILGKVSADKAAAILSCLKSTINWITPTGTPAATAASTSIYTPPSYSGKGLTTERAGQILEGLGADKAAAILASDNIKVETAGYILNELNKTNEAAVTGMLAKLDATNKVKADQIREKITSTGKAWLNQLGDLTPEDAAAKINAYVVDEATAKEVADALLKIDPVKAGLILSHYKITNATIGRVLSTMDAADAANILFAQAADSTEPAVGNMRIIYIMQQMSPDKAAAIIDTYCKSSGSIPARVEAIFRKMVPADSAKIFASDNMSVDVAANIISAVKTAGFQEKADSILAAIDSVNKAKADQIREKIASATDITKMTADQAADYLTKLNDPAKAATELAKLDANKAAAALNSAKMTSGVAAKILGAMDENKVAEILSASMTEMILWDTAGTTKDGLGYPPIWNTPVLNAAKAAEILGKLETAKAASILSKVKMDTSVAAGIFSVMAPEAAAKIMAKMDKEKAAGILTNVAVDTAAKIVSKMDIDTAVGVFSYDIMGTVSAANILYALKKTDEKKVTDILAKLETAKPARAADIKAKMGIGSTDLSLMLPDVAVDYLIKLNDPAKAATELAKIDAISAAKIIASGKMTTDLAANILSKMDAAKAAEILSSNGDLGWLKLAASNDANLLGVPFMGTNVIDAAKAAEILSKMDEAKAAAIIGNDKMDNSTAAELMGRVDLQKAIAILGKVSADKTAAILSVLKRPTRWLDYTGKIGDLVASTSLYVLPDYWGKGLTPEQAGNILAGLGADKAAAILASKNMSVETAGKVLNELNKTNAQAVTGMLAKLDATDKTKADLIRAKISAIDIGTMTPEAAAKYLSGLDPKAAAVLLKTFIGSFYENVASAAAIVAKMDAAKAANVLAELNAFDAGVIIGSDNISVSTAMQIFSRMNSDKAVAILATSNTAVAILASVLYPNPPQSGGANSLTYEKAADILAAMINPGPYSAAALRGIMDKISADDAALIISQMDPERASVLLRQPEELPEGVMKQGDIGQLVKADKAASILASKHMAVETAGTILSKADANTQKVVLAQLDKTDKAKADQIRATIAATDKSWLNDLGNLKPEDAAAKIAAYVKDAATAKEVADALNKLEAFKAGQIIAQSGMTAQLAAQVFDQMTAQQVAGILNSNIVPMRFYDSVNLVNCPPAYRVISYLKAAEILVAMDTGKAAAALAALPAYTAGNILFAQDPGNTQPAVTNMKIIYLLRAMSADSAAAIINMYCDPRNGLQKIDLANGTSIKPNTAIPARVEQIFRKMVPSESAPIFASDNMSVKTAARIISEVKKGFPDKANLILNAIDGVNPEKASFIRTVINVLGGAEYVPGQLIIKLKVGVDSKVFADTLTKIGAKIEKDFGGGKAGVERLYLIGFPETTSVVNAISLLAQTKLFEYAEPNCIIHLEPIFNVTPVS